MPRRTREAPEILGWTGIRYCRGNDRVHSLVLCAVGLYASSFAGVKARTPKGSMQSNHPKGSMEEDSMNAMPMMSGSMIVASSRSRASPSSS